MLIVAHDQIRQKTDRRSHRLHSLAKIIQATYQPALAPGCARHDR